MFDRAPSIIIATGLTVAIIVFFIAPSKPPNPFGYEPLENKRYIHDLELYGGKANLLAAEFNDWFAGLWYGRNLAYTIAVISVILALCARVISNSMEPTSED